MRFWLVITEKKEIYVINTNSLQDRIFVMLGLHSKEPLPHCLSLEARDGARRFNFISYANVHINHLLILASSFYQRKLSIGRRKLEGSVIEGSIFFSLRRKPKGASTTVPCKVRVSLIVS